ncbi:MAG: EAL domain-containing protein [Gammaproteobacteria bacterium]
MSAESNAMPHLRAAIQAGQVGLWDWDLCTDQVYYSPEWKRQIGYRDEELSNDFSEWQSRVHPDDSECIKNALQAYLQKPVRGYQQEFRFRHKDGSYRWIYTQASLISDADEETRSAMLGSHVDITEHQKLTAQQQRGALLESISDAFVALDSEWCYTFVNSRAEKLLGRQPEALLGKNIWKEFPDSAGTVLQKDFQRAMRDRIPLQTEFYFPPWDRWFENRIYPAQDSGLSIFFTDITARKQAEYKIHRLNRMYAMLSGINALIVRVRDQQELFDDACSMAVETGSFGMAWVDGVDAATRQITPIAASGPDSASFSALRAQGTSLQAWGRVINTRQVAVINDLGADMQRGHTNERRRLSHRLGYRALIVLPLFREGALIGLFTLLSKEANVFTGDEVKLLTEMAGDISFALDYLAKVQQLDYLAYYDVLTGLPNRTLFSDHIDREARRAQRDQTLVAIVLCDINRFRHINETLGRQAGDALLCELAKRFRQHWPEAENIGRIAADCFGGIITGLKSAADIAQRIETPLHELLYQPIKVEGKVFRLTLTLGIALAPHDGSESEVLLKNAEIALKEAKSRGERRLLYQPQMNAAVSATLTLEIKLRQALEQQQFVLHYQPKIDLMTGAVSGLEALLRWHDPEQGLIPPGCFIPLLEETGMILDVGRWVIRQALTDYHQWYIQGLQPPRIAVNISAVQLRREDFVDSIAESIKTTRAGPHGLDLELTESQLIEDLDTTVGKLQQLRTMGIKIAIDDFGTGFSSLGYLARLPVDALKIDRSFTMTMVDDANSMSIVSAIISLAHTLGLKVIAEGVETHDQKRYLSVLKCDEFQGYLYSPPVSFEQITQLLEERRIG